MLTIANISALRAYSEEGFLSRLEGPLAAGSVDWALGSAFDLRHIDIAALGLAATREDPLHILVDEKYDRVRSGRLKSHVWSTPVPPGSLFRLSDEVLVSSPGFCVLQLAARRSTAVLTAACMELCGGYGRDPGCERGFRDRAPVARPSELKAYLDGAAGAYGSAKAREAARLCLAGSRSPMETVLALILLLPAQMGGAGFPPEACLNYRIDAPWGSFQTGRRYYLADLCWPEQRVICEYNGLDYHADRASYGRDVTRNEELRDLGWDVHVATAATFSSLQVREGFLARVAESLGIDAPDQSTEAFRARNDLAADLLHW